ncbi:hypothetical protein GBP14_08470, partial [Pediococcus acidilactici]
MTEYILTRKSELKNTAGQKAKEDIKKILLSHGFNKLGIKIRDSRLKKVMLTKFDTTKILGNVQKDDVIFLQYPISSRYTTKVILRECNKRGIKIVGIIHDIESLRLYKNNPTKIKDEIDILKGFDCIISHNQRMNDWLRLSLIHI